MKISNLIIFICLLNCTLTPSFAQDRKTLIFATPTSASDVITAYHQFLQQAYGEIGYDVDVIRLPVVRSYVHAALDKADGILISTKSILEEFENLVVVPVVLRQVHLSAFSTAEIKIDGPGSLQGYKIGILRGYPLSKRITEGMERQIVDNYTSLAAILKLGRVDIILALEKEMERFLEGKPAYACIKMLNPPILTIPMYHFLSKKNEPLVARIAPVLERLIKENVFETLYAPYQIKCK